jgi:hypothetical protein
MQKLSSMDKEQQPQSLGYVTTANDRDEEGVGFSYKVGVFIGWIGTRCSSVIGTKNDGDGGCYGGWFGIAD